MIYKFVVFFMIVFSQISFAGNICVGGGVVDDVDTEFKPQTFTTYKISDLFEIDQTLTDQQPILDKAFKEIQKNPVGHCLIHSLCTEIVNHPENFKKPIEKVGKLDPQHQFWQYGFDPKRDEQEDFDKYKTILQKILLTKGERSGFVGTYTINDSNAWNNVKTYEKFRLKITLRDVSDSKVSVYNPQSESILSESSPFYMLLAHEMIHAAEFLQDPSKFRFKSNFLKSDLANYWSQDIPLTDESGKNWDCRLTELLDVIGREKPSSNIERVSELTMRLSDKLPIRFPYNTEIQCKLEKNDVNLLDQIIKIGKKQNDYLKSIGF